MTPAAFWLRWLAIAVGLGTLLWFAMPDQRVGAPLTARPADRWTLAEIPRWQLPLSAPALIAGASMWGAAPPKAETVDAISGPDPRWRLAGVLGTGNDRRVLVSYMDPAKPPSLVRVGESLPSGHRIVRIDERQVCVVLGKRSVTLGLEPLNATP